MSDFSKLAIVSKFQSLQYGIYSLFTATRYAIAYSIDYRVYVYTLSRTDNKRSKYMDDRRLENQ